MSLNGRNLIKLYLLGLIRSFGLTVKQKTKISKYYMFKYTKYKNEVTATFTCLSCL